MGALQDDTAVTKDGEALSATLSRDWEIWGPNGGYLSVIALRAAGAIAPPDHRPASYSCQYLTQAKFEPLDIQADAVRKGRNVWCINVALVQGGRKILQAQIWTTNKSDGPEKTERRMPDVPKPAALKTWIEQMPPGTPKHRFWMNFESKPVTFLPPGAHEPRGSLLQDWYRYAGFVPTSDPFLDCGRALLLIDTVLWPAFHRGMPGGVDYIAPSLDVSAWFHTPPGSTEWLLLDARADAASAGLIHGTASVWSEDGRLIATGGSNMLHFARG